MFQQRVGARAEYLQEQSLRVKEAASLAVCYRGLRSLRVDLEYYDPEGSTRGAQIKYDANLANAKSVLRFSCPNTECIRGDFDLSEELADAVAAGRTSVAGELSCPGWRSKTTVDSVHCQHILRYRLHLGY